MCPVVYNFLFFHSLAEIFSIILACGIFFIAWNSRRFLNNNCLLFIGVAYLFVAGIDLAHALSFAGMGVFSGYDPNVSTHLWICARYLQAISVAVAPLLLTRQWNPDRLFIVFSAVFAMIMASIFVWDIVPVYIAEGTGLTASKITSEFLICLISVGFHWDTTRISRSLRPGHIKTTDLVNHVHYRLRTGFRRCIRAFTYLPMS